MAKNRPTFEAFVRDYSSPLLRTAYLLAWDEREAEDLVQETLFRVARKWGRVASMEHPLAYARRILVRLAIGSSPRRERHRAELRTDINDISRSPDLTDEGDAITFRAELIDAIATLSPRQRAVIVLRYYADLSEAETAIALGCSVGTVKSSASRGLAELRQTLRTLEPRSAGL